MVLLAAFEQFAIRFIASANSCECVAYEGGTSSTRSYNTCIY